MKWLYAAGIVVASFFVSLWAMNYLSPPCPQGKVTALNRPFQHWGAATYFASAPGLTDISDSGATPSRSNILVCEDNRALGPAHAAHSEIADKGRGRFSHWGNGVAFSSSDNSDPNANGRTYRAIQPQ